MMGPEAIQAVNQEIAERAAADGKVPYVPWDGEEVRGWASGCPIPNLGYFTPDGWVRMNESWFVDKTGMGQSDEPALTAEQFAEQAAQYFEEHGPVGFAIIEDGEFQAWVGAFRRAD